MQKTDADRFVAEQLSLFDAGREDLAFSNLVEASVDVTPSLITAFQRAEDWHVQTFILSVVWNSHDTRYIPLFAAALASDVDGVWKGALDGLSSSASVESQAILKAALPCRDAEKAAWIAEAAEQVEAVLKGN